MNPIFDEKDRIEILVLDSENTATIKSSKYNDDEVRQNSNGTKIESQILVHKCLKELVKIYRISTLIELSIFLIFLSIFFVFDFYNGFYK